MALRAHLVVVGDEWADAHHERDAALAAALAAARANDAVVVALGASACRALALGRVGLVPFRVAVVDPGTGTGDGAARDGNMRRRLRRPRPHPWERS